MRHHTRKLGLLFTIPFVAATAIACSSGDDGSDDITTPRDGGEETPRDAGVDRDGGPPRDAGPRDGGNEPPPFDGGCAIEENVDTTPDQACNGTAGTWTVTVSGRVNDPQGNPADGAGVNICLTDARNDQSTCLIPRPVCADGRYEVLVPESFRCATHMVARAFSTGDNTAFTYCDITAGAARLEVTEPVSLFETIRVPDLEEGDPLVEQTVTFDDGLEMDVVPDDFPAPFEELGAVRVQQSEVCTLAGSPTTYEGIYAFSPETDLNSVTFPIRIPNTTGLAANSSVRLYVLGGLLCSVPRPGMDDYLVDESEWYEFGTAQVTADGTMIEGGDLPCVGWLAYSAM
ncbi:MAG: hypothetical protein RIT81_36925 [Deltaproteobacteria bacterium]